MAFAVLNAILCYTRVSCISDTKSIVRNVIPIICRFFQRKTLAKDEMLNSTRDEILIFIFYIYPYLESMVMDESFDNTLPELVGLLEVMRTDYSKRSDRDQLHLDDLEMINEEAVSRGLFHLSWFQLRAHNYQAERNWAFLHIIGILERLVNLANESVSTEETENNIHSVKRQRFCESQDRVLESIESNDERIKLAGLQILPFILENFDLSYPRLKLLLAHLYHCAGSKNDNIGAWALLAIASCSLQIEASKIQPLEWMQFWLVGIRSLAHQSSCRSASVLLHSLLVRNLVEHKDIVEVIDSIVTAAETSGPVSISDASIFLMVHLLNTRAIEVPSVSSTVAQHVIRWLFGRWKPVDRYFAMHHSVHVQPKHILLLLRTCLGLDTRPITTVTLPCGRLTQAWQRYLDERQITNYLLLIDTPLISSRSIEACSGCFRSSNYSGNMASILATAKFQSTRKLILEMLHSTCINVLHDLRSYVMEHISNVPTEIYRSTIYSCIVMLSMLTPFIITKSEQIQDFITTTMQFAEQFVTLLSDLEIKDKSDFNKLSETLIQAINPYIPAFGLDMCSELRENSPYLLKFFNMLTAKFKENYFKLAQTQFSNIDPIDSNDDHDFLPYKDNQSIMERQKLRIFPRSRMDFDVCAGSFYTEIIGKLSLITAINATSDFFGPVPTTFFDYLLSLTDEDFLSSQKLVLEIISSNLVVDGINSNRIIERMGNILSSNNLGRCEVTLALSADILAALKPYWSNQNENDKAESASQIYEWLINTVIGKDIASTEVQKSVSRLLFVVLSSRNHDYETAEPTLSARSCLLTILKKGSLAIKFYLADHLKIIFEHMNLKDYDIVFSDILGSLPTDMDWLEGISFRLFVLTKLSSTLSTLLRRCIYHIFETPTQIIDSSVYAKRCIKEISSKIQLQSSQELFKLFAPQLLYTWLERENLIDIPFKIFGFKTLRDLAETSKEELTALMIMRGQEDLIQQLSSILNTTEIELVLNSFTKVIAYSVYCDLKNSLTVSKGGVEHRIKKLLGEKIFLQYINLHFVDIIAVFFNCLDQETTMKKYFIKTSDFEYAANIFDKIISFSSSEVVLPPNQQPLFKAKYLVAEIQHLCSLTRHSIKNIFTPTLVVSIVRSLLNTCHPALGSLHSCSVIRKIRVLVALSGNTATIGYPLEMLLHSLRPFLQNFDCVEDIIGIMQYLLESGSEYLLNVPSFVAGLSLTIFGSLKKIDSHHSSSPQKSPYQCTRLKIQKFNEWIGQYFRSYSSPLLLNSRENRHFRNLIDAACSAKSIGNANSESSESNLLIGLLRDEGLENGLLSRPSRRIVLSMLTTEFSGPITYRNDVCGDDKKSVLFSPAVLKSCRKSSSKQYQVWAAKVIGRAFVSSGDIHKELIHESNLAQIRKMTVSKDRLESSTSALLNLLREVIISHDLKAIGFAEIALRHIVENADKDLVARFKLTLPESLLIASIWDPYQLPPSEKWDSTKYSLNITDLLTIEEISKENWLRDFSIALVKSTPQEPLLAAVVFVLSEVPKFADKAFPFITHLILSSRFCNTGFKNDLSYAFNRWLGNSTVKKSYKRMLLDSILYLRTQHIQGENSPADRAYWLKIDYHQASIAAISCGMYKTALLFIEEFYSQSTKSSRRSSSIKDYMNLTEIHTNTLLQIYKNIDDPDLYYGVKQNADWDAVIARFEYEKDGLKSLAFKGAQFDSNIRKNNMASSDDVQSLVKAFDILNLSGVSNSLLQAHQTVCLSESSIESLFRTSRKLEQWDVPIPSSYDSNSVAIYKVFKTISSAIDYHSVKQIIDEGLEFTIDKLINKELSTAGLHEVLQTLAALVEIDEVFGSCGSDQFEKVYDRFNDRSHWMKVGNFDDVNLILSCRGTILSTLSQRQNLQDIIKIKEVDSRLVQVQTALLASNINRAHNNLQEALALASSMIDLIIPCKAVGVNAEAAIQLESANTLWDQGELSSSIGMLQALDNTDIMKKQTIVVGRSRLLAKIGYQVSIAKLEKADRIIGKYLEPALKELRGKSEGCEAGQVFHQFAAFCDQQLQDPESLEDLERLKEMSNNKAEEVKDYEKLIAKAVSPESKRECISRQIKAKAWLKIDKRDLERQISNREEFLSHCLENYLLSLISSNDHDRNALRFLSLWLEHSAEDVANKAVAKHLKRVPSMKFANLMNQLTSRLQDTKDKFQELLFQLVMQICSDHPYHGMYQIFSGAFSDTSDKDEAAISRRNATRKLASRLTEEKIHRNIWASIQSTSKAYCALAGENCSRYKSGKKFQLNESPAATALNSVIKKYPIPSPTRKIPFSLNLDYSKEPVILKIKAEFSIASGVSAPKIIIAVAEDGETFKQLVKGGNDDLRQDAIMEQVFEQVSDLLKTNRSTQQRQLRIRTYRVLPLTNVAGIIEFVPNTIPLHEYLMPAHERFYPKDLKAIQCRNEIAAVQTKSAELRIKTFRALTERFHPVMRYFFTEKFYDPDEWFVKRLAYVRSTAAISILGHVLGLGDRHANNILLDQKSGEVVHIDLGIAFEMGRILPIPETVPFRLTRDIVDGMGITKTEGVFRRCCESTLEVLQKESYTIMSILDVLRYDPLYSWSVSPVRLAKLREEQDGLDIAGATSKTNEKKLINEPGEAARALSSTSKKLQKTLSVYATVNDLINQASDERNLALLFAGWAAYA